MECLGPECVSMLLEWMKTRSAELDVTTSSGRAPEVPRQALLFKTVAYQEDAPAVRSPAEFAGAHRAPGVRRLSEISEPVDPRRAARLDNTIDNALFKAERFAAAARRGRARRAVEPTSRRSARRSARAASMPSGSASRPAVPT